MNETLGPYRLVRELGRGGMGVVYEAQHPEIPRRLAVKTILSSVASPEALERFQREARALAKVRHPNVVQVHDLGRDGRGLFLVTDLVEGEDLKALCRRGPLDAQRAARITRVLAEAVSTIHAAGILHRDLKPENVILRPDETPVLLDFGLAREDDEERLTETGSLLGSPNYMAPEQAQGSKQGALDERTDVYGLGAILFALLTGAPPFVGGSLVNVIRRVLLEEPDWPEAPAGLQAILRKAMAKEQQQRYPSAAALRDDLDRYLSGGLVAAQEASPRTLVAVTGVTVTLLALVVGGLALRARQPGQQPGKTTRGAKPAKTIRRARPVAPRPGKRPPSKELARVRRYLEGNEQTRRAMRTERLAVLGTRKVGIESWGVFLDDRWIVYPDPPSGQLDRGRRRRILRSLDLQTSRPGRTWQVSVPWNRASARFPVRIGQGFLFASDRDVLWVRDRQADVEKVWTIPRTAEYVIKEPERAVFAIAVSPDRSRIAVGGDFAHVYVFDLEGPRTPRTYGPHPGRIEAIRFTPDGTRLITGVPRSQRSPVTVWDLASAIKLHQYVRGSRVQRLAVHPRHALAMGRNDGQVALFRDLDRREPQEILPLQGDTEPGRLDAPKVQGLAFSPDGNWLYSSHTWDRRKENSISWSELRVWDTRRRQRVGRRIRLAKTLLRTMDCSPSGHLLLLGTLDGEVVLWGAPPRTPGGS